MRLDDASQDYAKLLDSIGTGDKAIHDGNLNLKFAQLNFDNSDKNRVKLPQHLYAKSEDEAIDWMYGGNVLRVDNADDIKDSCLLTPLNDASLEINHKVR